MKRQFRGNRLYKLVKIIVLIITIFCLTLGIYAFSGRSKIMMMYLDRHYDCIHNGGFSADICMDYLKQMGNYDSWMWGYLAIGALSPIVFFGGGILINYLFPKKDKKHE